MCSRRKRLPKDRLSSLQDDILFSILSFLPCKEAVKTGLLSHRWLNLWMYTSSLHFDARVPKAVVASDLAKSGRERRHYIKVVNRVLQKHKAHYLKEFKIVCGLDRFNQIDIDNWLEFAFAKKVQSLELNLFGPGDNPRFLENNYVFLGRFHNFGSGNANSYGGMNNVLQFDLKCLKSLSLKKVDVTSKAINFLLLNCPFLERLEVFASMKLRNLVISDPTLVLKHLQIKNCHYLKVLSISNINLVSLDISAVRDLTLTNLSMLVEFYINGVTNVLSYSLSQASSCFFQLEALMLKGRKLQDATLLSNYDQLTKLKRLVIHVGAWGDESLIAVFSIINSCPRLEEFVLMLDWFNHPKQKTFEVVRHSSSLNNKSLKVFEFVGYYGRVTDDELIMHVLANAVGLEKMVIDPRNAMYVTCNALHIEKIKFVEAEKEARINAWRRYEAFKGYIPPHVHLLIR